MGPTPFQRHFELLIAEAPVHDKGEQNEYHSATFMPSLVKYFLPHAPLWSSLMLGECTVINVLISAISTRYLDMGHLDMNDRWLTAEPVGGA